MGRRRRYVFKRTPSGRNVQNESVCGGSVRVWTRWSMRVWVSAVGWHWVGEAGLRCARLVWLLRCAR